MLNARSPRRTKAIDLGDGATRREPVPCSAAIRQPTNRYRGIALTSVTSLQGQPIRTKNNHVASGAENAIAMPHQNNTRNICSRSGSGQFASTRAPTAENGLASTTVAEMPSAMTTPVTLTAPVLSKGSESGITTPRTPGLAANTDVIAATKQIRSTPSVGVLATLSPMTLMAPVRCSSAM
jgi:hypothetical protein